MGGSVVVRGKGEQVAYEEEGEEGARSRKREEGRVSGRG